MRLLVDSHVFLWLLFEPQYIGTRARAAIADADTVQASAASIWELTLKHRKGKLPHPPEQLVDGISALHLDELPVAARHLRRLPDVELPHDDPFDALLVAQTLAEGAILLTADRVLLSTPHQTLDVRE